MAIRAPDGAKNMKKFHKGGGSTRLHTSFSQEVVKIQQNSSNKNRFHKTPGGVSVF